MKSVTYLLPTPPEKKCLFLLQTLLDENLGDSRRTAECACHARTVLTQLLPDVCTDEVTVAVLQYVNANKRVDFQILPGLNKEGLHACQQIAEAGMSAILETLGVAFNMVRQEDDSLSTHVLEVEYADSAALTLPNAKVGLKPSMKCKPGEWLHLFR